MQKLELSPERFRAAFDRDSARGLIGDGSLSDWRYMQRSRTPRDQALLFSYHGPQDLLHWIANRLTDLDRPPAEGPRPRGYWAQPAYAPSLDDLLERSSEAHETLLASVEGDFDRDLYDHRFQDVYNAQDFHCCTALGTGIRTVLDYGAGYARQAPLFATVIPDARYIAVDAVEQSYLLQSWVLDRLGLLRWEYLDHADEGEMLASALEEQAGAFHVPSWRLDLLPDGAIDLVLFVWSLYEMSGAAAREAIEGCRRLVRLGGYVYIRDMPHTESYRFDPERLLRSYGFELVYWPQKIGHDEIHGQQRLYRRTALRRRSTAANALARARELGARAKEAVRRS